MQLNATDLGIVSNALRIAAKRFNDHSIYLEAAGYSAMAETFKKQESEALRVYKILADAGIQT